MKEFSFLVKAYERPRALKRCLASIREHFPRDVPVIVVDDGRRPSLEDGEIGNYGDLNYIRTEYDVGLSAGRNIAVDACLTDYFVLLDDDFEAIPETRVERALPWVRTGAFDVFGGLVLVNGSPNYYWADMEQRGKVVAIRSFRDPIDRPVKADLVLNFFAARTEVIRNIRWDDRLKLGEHVDFFLRLQEGGAPGRILSRLADQPRAGSIEGVQRRSPREGPAVPEAVRRTTRDHPGRMVDGRSE